MPPTLTLDPPRPPRARDERRPPPRPRSERDRDELILHFVRAILEERVCEAQARAARRR